MRNFVHSYLMLHQVLHLIVLLANFRQDEYSYSSNEFGFGCYRLGFISGKSVFPTIE